MKYIIKKMVEVYFNRPAKIEIEFNFQECESHDGYSVTFNGDIGGLESFLTTMGLQSIRTSLYKELDEFTCEKASASSSAMDLYTATHR